MKPPKNADLSLVSGFGPIVRDPAASRGFDYEAFAEDPRVAVELAGGFRSEPRDQAYLLRDDVRPLALPG